MVLYLFSASTLLLSPCRLILVFSDIHIVKVETRKVDRRRHIRMHLSHDGLPSCRKIETRSEEQRKRGDVDETLGCDRSLAGGRGGRGWEVALS